MVEIVGWFLEELLHYFEGGGWSSVLLLWHVYLSSSTIVILVKLWLDPVGNIGVSTLIVVVHLIFKHLVTSSSRILSRNVAKQVLRLFVSNHSRLRAGRTSHPNLDVINLLLLDATHCLKLIGVLGWNFIPFRWVLSVLLSHIHDLILLNFVKLITLLLIELLLVWIFVFPSIFETINADATDCSD